MTEKKINRLKRKLEELVTEKKTCIETHEKLIEEMKQKKARIQKDYNKVQEQLMLEEQEKDRKDLFIIRNDPKLWKSYYETYKAYDFARKQNDYLKHFHFTEADMDLADAYFHLTEPELAKIIDFGFEHKGNFKGHWKEYQIKFEFNDRYGYSGMQDKLYALKIRRLQICSILFGEKSSVTITMAREQPPLGRSEIAQFRRDLQKKLI
jgi:hypothetical protein